MSPHVTRFGFGPASVLAIHCTLAHSGAWKGMANALDGIADVTAFDLPGHGRSPDWDPYTDSNRLAADWGLALLDKPKHVVGHSFGGTVAMRMAIERPDLCLSLTLIEPVFFAAARVDQPDVFAAHIAQLKPFHTALQVGETETAARLFNRMWGDGTRWMDFSDKQRRYMRDRIGFVVGSEGFMVDDDTDVLGSGVLGRLPMPVTLVQGALALDIMNTTIASLHARIPQADCAVVPGAGHMVPITHPDETAAIVRQQIERSGA